jgi:hypothetical protein
MTGVGLKVKGAHTTREFSKGLEKKQSHAKAAHPHCVLLFLPPFLRSPNPMLRSRLTPGQRH